MTWIACGGGGPAAPAPPAGIVAVSPTGGARVETETPVLVVQNPPGFDAGQASYDFLVMDHTGERTLQQVTGVAAGNGRTQATVPEPLPRGVLHTWKAVARAGGQTLESSPESFYVQVACQTGGDPYAKAVVDFFITQCTRKTNRAPLLDPQAVLGPPDARGAMNQEERFGGILSLGQDGYVVVDMGVCIEDRDGPDLRVFQFVESEPVKVRLSGAAGGPWTDLGVKPCGDGGLPTVSNHCAFDMAGTGLRLARYVWVEDGENFPCEDAGTRSEGADIDAVEVLHVAP